MPPMQTTRRGFLVAAACGLAGQTGCAEAQARDLAVYKTPWCGCCTGWVTHMRRAGFRPTVHMVEDLAPIRRRYGIAFELPRATRASSAATRWKGMCRRRT